MPSATVENYVKKILVLSLETREGQVGMGEIAKGLEVAAGTATSMIKNLERTKLVRYKSRQGVTLTAKGRKLGMDMLRRHRLVETFLVETLGLDWTEIHQEAEELEHAISEKFSIVWTNSSGDLNSILTAIPYLQRTENLQNGESATCWSAKVNNRAQSNF